MAKELINYGTSAKKKAVTSEHDQETLGTNWRTKTTDR
jgi:hypothetical protein